MEPIGLLSQGSWLGFVAVLNLNHNFIENHTFIIMGEKIILTVFINSILIISICKFCDVFDILLNSDFCSSLILIFTILLIIRVLRQLSYSIDNKYRYIKLFTTSMIILISMYLLFYLILKFQYKINVYLSSDALTLFKMIGFFTFISTILPLFFRKKKLKKIDNEDVLV